MQRRKLLSPAQVKVESLALIGGTDVVSSPSLARPGMARACVNYESAHTGGYQRIGGFERFDGRPRPSDAQYTTLAVTTAYTGVVVGDTLNGQTSGATGVVAHLEPTYIVVTKKVGTFTSGENLRVGSTVIGVMGAETPSVSAQQDNVLYAAAAERYRVDIAAVPGSGPVRGIAALGSRVFAWRDTADGLSMKLYKDSAAGWVEVPRYYEYPFRLGTSQYTDGETLTQGGVSATIKRVVVETGEWGPGTAAGRLITTEPVGGNFANGVAAGGGACTLQNVPATSALAQISFLPGGKVETDTWNFMGSQETLRLYGCDGVNREFEFDGDVWVPLTSGMPVKAKFVRAHKNYLCFAFKGSLQHTAVGSPYSFDAVLGGAEIGAGDEITGLMTTAGSEDSAAMVIVCRNSTHILYGTGPSTWNLVTLSRNAGAYPYSLQDAGAPIGHDQQGFRIFSPTQAFGNFSWNLSSHRVDPIVRKGTPACSVFSTRLSRYRCFFDNGDTMSGTIVKENTVLWTQLRYGIKFNVAYEGEVDNISRVFYGGDDGMVYEADVGRSFDGEPIQAAVRLISINITSPMLIKQFRAGDVEITSESAFTLYASAEFDNGAAEVEVTNQQRFAALYQQQFRLVGAGGFWDISDYEVARWDAAGEHRQRLEFVGRGYGIGPIFYSLSDNELPHTIKSLSLVYSPRNIKRS